MQYARTALRTIRPRSAFVAVNHNACAFQVAARPRFFNSSAFRFQEEKAEAEAETEAQKPTEEEEVTPAADPAVENLKKELAQCQEALDLAEAKAKEFNDKMLRAYAEAENARNRATKDVENAKNFALQGFVKSLLDTTDNLGWALDASRTAAEKGDNADLKTLFDGVVLTETTLMNSLKAHGVERFESLGQKFDPNLHDGLFQFEDPTKEPGTVGSVMKEGYTYNGRCIRPANVGTVQAPKAQ